MVAITPAASQQQSPTIRRIGRADLHWALREGVRDFLDKRGDIILIGIVYPLVLLVVGAVSVGGEWYPVVLPLISGLSLLGPILAVGYYEMARRREEGRDGRWSHFLDPFHGPNGAQIIALGILLGLLFLAWIGVAMGIYGATLGTLHPDGLGSFIGKLFTTAEGWQLIAFGNLAGFGFAVVVLATTIVSFPLMVDRPVDFTLAVETSIRATRKNPAEVATWGLYVAIILALACIPLFCGLLVALPVLGYASWHLYTRLVERDA